MLNENHKKTWDNFTKFVLWGTVAVICVLVLMAIKMKIIIDNVYSRKSKYS